eukprot:scaffold5284_cov191-Amphora_coffeaeformis.AAC.2
MSSVGKSTERPVEVPEEGAVAILRGRTNVVDKAGSSEQGGKGLGGRSAWGRVSTASTTSSPTRRSAADRKRWLASWVKAMKKG